MAQEAPPRATTVDMQTAAREAVSWHPSIIEAAARLNAQEQRIDEVKAARYPQITGGAGWGYDSTVRNSWRPRPNIGVTQRLFDFGKLSSELDFERAGVNLTRTQVLLSVDAIVGETSYSIIEILRGTELLIAARDQLERVRAIGGLVEARFQRGATTRSDAYQTQSRVDAAEATIQQIDAELLRWQTNLAYLLGRDEVPAVAGTIPVTLSSACRMPDPAWDVVPAIREAEARLVQAEAQARRQRAERYPTVSLGVNGSTDIADPFGDNRAAYNFGLNVSSTLFNGGANQARIRGAEFAREAAGSAVQAARLNSTRQFAAARSQVEALNARTITLQRRLATMEQTRELYRLQYLELSTRTLVDLLNADQELSQIRFDAVNARHDLHRLAVDCLLATGTLRQTLELDDMTVEGVAL